MTWREAMDALRRAARERDEAARPEDRLRMAGEVKRWARIARALTEERGLSAPAGT